MKRPFADQTNQSSTISCSDHHENIDLILPRSTQNQLINFLDSVYMIEQATDQQKLKINHTIDHLVLLLTNLQQSHHSQLQPPLKKNKLEDNDSTCYQIKNTLIQYILAHLFKIRNLIVSTPDHIVQIDALMEAMEDNKILCNKITYLDLIEMDSIIEQSNNSNSLNLFNSLNAPNDLYLKTSAFDLSILSDMTQLALLPDSTTSVYEKSTNSFYENLESDDSISDHFLPMPTVTTGSSPVENEQSFNQELVSDENLDLNYFDDGVRQWPSNHHSTEDLIKYLKTNYQKDSDFKNFIDKNELFSNYERFFAAVQNPVKRNVFYKHFLSTLNVKNGTRGHAPRTRVYRYLVRRVI